MLFRSASYHILFSDSFLCLPHFAISSFAMSWFRWAFTMRTSNSSTENLAKYSLFTVYWTGFFSFKSFCPPVKILFFQHMHRGFSHMYCLPIFHRQDLPFIKKTEKQYFSTLFLHFYDKPIFLHTKPFVLK